MATAPAGYKAKVVRDWIIPQGADALNSFHPFQGTEDDPTYLDLAGWSARAQIRDSVGGDVWAAMTSGDIAGARIALEDGWIHLIVPAAVTETEQWDDWDKGVYDVELVDPDGGVTRLAQGKVTISHDVTRSDS